MLRRTDEEIWQWHQLIQAQKTSGLSQLDFCKQREIDYKAFSNVRFRMEYKSVTDPERNAELVQLVREYRTSHESRESFAKRHGLDKNVLCMAITHVVYQDALAKIKAKQEPEEMQFIQAPTIPLQQRGILATKPPNQSEFVEKQNDIEIIISKGVRVTISPNIDPMKIIKIIELLKDL